MLGLFTCTPPTLGSPHGHGVSTVHNTRVLLLPSQRESASVSQRTLRDLPEPVDRQTAGWDRRAKNWSPGDTRYWRAAKQRSRSGKLFTKSWDGVQRKVVQNIIAPAAHRCPTRHTRASPPSSSVCLDSRGSDVGIRSPNKRPSSTAFPRKHPQPPTLHF